MDHAEDRCAGQRIEVQTTKENKKKRLPRNQYYRIKKKIRMPTSQYIHPTSVSEVVTTGRASPASRARLSQPPSAAAATISTGRRNSSLQPELSSPAIASPTILVCRVAAHCSPSCSLFSWPRPCPPLLLAVPCACTPCGDDCCGCSGCCDCCWSTPTEAPGSG